MKNLNPITDIEMIPIKRALISVVDKDGISLFARSLERMGIELIATRETHGFLKERGIVAKEVSEVTGSDNIFDGQVDTIHPAIYGGLLADRNNPEHQKQINEHGILPIDLLVANLHPISDINSENYSLIRAASKNFRSVATVVTSDDYSTILDRLEKNDGSLALLHRLELATIAFAYVAEYSRLVSEEFSQVDEALS